MLAMALFIACVTGEARAGVPPANDNFPGTVTGALPFEETVDTTAATVEVDEPIPTCSFENVSTAWWSFTATETEVLIARAKSDEFAPLMTVWSESSFPGGGLVEVWCDGFPGFPGDPDYPPEPGRMDVSFPFQADSGETYYVQIGGFDDFFFGGGQPSSGVVDFSLYAPVPPPNDDFAAAELIPGLPFSGEAEATAATTEPGEAQPSCLGIPGFPLEAASTVWYSYTPVTDLDVLIDTRMSQVFPFVAVHTGAAGALTEVACGIDLLTFEAVAGETYYIQTGALAFTDFPDQTSGFIRFTMQEFEPLDCPSGAEQQWTDPLNDNLATPGFQADAIGMTAVSSGQIVCITLEFDDLRLGSEDEDDWTFTFLNFDLDQNPDTGAGGDGEEPCMAPGVFGYEGYVGFDNTGTITATPVSIVGVVPQGVSGALATITYTGDSVTVAMPVAPLGDSDFDVIVQVYNSENQAADCIPNTDAMTVTGPVVVRFGDVNCSGQVGTADVRDILAHAGGIDAPANGDCTAVGEPSGYTYPAGEAVPPVNGDVDCSGEADSRDALYLLHYLSGSMIDVSLCPDPGTPPVQ